MLGVPGTALPADFLAQIMQFHCFNATIFVILVLAICAVKISILFLFQRLIARTRQGA